jgi:putative ABC transport system permease protein
MFPGNPLEYFFLDEDFDLQYGTEEKIGKIFSAFTIFGLFIACLGLFGLIAFIAEQRTKEIGIRKTLGASNPGIVLMLTKEFIGLILIGAFIACPASYFGLDKWLQDFAYRINLGWTTFVIAGLLSLIIALLTVSYQAYKAACKNPVNALKYE